MSRLGTYDTFDCPTKKDDEAYVWLAARVDKLGGRAWIKINQHDFGPYPSYEIDYPNELNGFIEDEDCLCGTCEDCKLFIVKEKFQEQMEAIYDAYNEMFMQD